jgi:predicted dehydrogenase
MSARLRVGLAGAGWVTQHHLAAWRCLSDKAVVVAIADPVEAQATARATEFGIPTCFASVRAMLDAGGLDAIDIAAPRAAHAGLVRLAAEYGLPVLCQKPLAPTLAEAEALVADVSGRIRLMVHENWRFRAYYRDMAAMLRQGRIGAVTAARLSILTCGTLPDADGHYPALERQPFMRHETRMLVAEVLIHHLDTLRMLLGPLKVEAASLSRTCPAIAGEDSAVIQLRTAAGAGVSVFASFAAHGAPAAQVDHLDILGHEGRLALDGATLSLAGAAPTAATYDLAATYRDSYAGAIGHFVDALRHDTPFETSPEDNLETLRLVEDCYRLSGWAGQAGG